MISGNNGKASGINNILLKKRSLLVIAFVVLISFGCSGRRATGGQYSMPPTAVEVAMAKTQTVVDRFDAVGTIEADEAISVVSEIDAAVISLPFEEGTEVKRGQLIAQLDDSQLAADVARTDALREQSKLSYDRVKALVDQGAGTPQDLDNAAAALKVAEANYALAQARFAKTRIVAPFDGFVGVRYVSTGAFVRMGQAITELANTYNLRVSFSVPENYLSQLNRGAEVAISTPSYSGQAIGKIIAIEPVIDPNTRNVRVVARVSNAEQRLRPGMSANISAVLRERPNAITIPSEAVFAAGNQSFVFVVKPDSTVARTGIVLGTIMADETEVISGLQPGLVIVKAGHQKLYDGAKVMPIQSQDSASTSNNDKSENN